MSVQTHGDLHCTEVVLLTTLIRDRGQRLGEGAKRVQELSIAVKEREKRMESCTIHLRQHPGEGIEQFWLMWECEMTEPGIAVLYRIAAS